MRLQGHSLWVSDAVVTFGLLQLRWHLILGTSRNHLNRWHRALLVRSPFCFLALALLGRVLPGAYRPMFPVGFPQVRTPPRRKRT